MAVDVYPASQLLLPAERRLELLGLEKEVTGQPQPDLDPRVIESRQELEELIAPCLGKWAEGGTYAVCKLSHRTWYESPDQDVIHIVGGHLSGLVLANVRIDTLERFRFGVQVDATTMVPVAELDGTDNRLYIQI